MCGRSRFAVAVFLVMVCAACEAPGTDAGQSADKLRLARERKAQMEKEQKVVEKAPWFGKTGLGADVERELPRYLRRELGESVFSPEALKASDLQYLGVFSEAAGPVRYWRIGAGSARGLHAYVTLQNGGIVMGYGDRKAPDAATR